MQGIGQRLVGAGCEIVRDAGRRGAVPRRAAGRRGAARSSSRRPGSRSTRPSGTSRSRRRFRWLPRRCLTGTPPGRSAASRPCDLGRRVQRGVQRPPDAAPASTPRPMRNGSRSRHPRRRHDPRRGRGGRIAAFAATEPRYRPDGSVGSKAEMLGAGRPAWAPGPRAGAGALRLGVAWLRAIGASTVTLSVSGHEPARGLAVRGRGLRADVDPRPVGAAGGWRHRSYADARREPARHGGCPPAVGGGARGARDRVLGDLLHRVGRVALDRRVLPLPVRAADPRAGGLGGTAAASGR